MIDLLLIWLLILAALIAFAVGRPRTGGALVMSYFLGLSLIHVPGAVVYADPLAPGDNREPTLLGFTLTVIGMAAFTAGAILARWTGKSVTVTPEPGIVSKLSPQAWPLIFVGIFSYFYLMPRAANIPSGTALVSSLGSLLIIGLWLRFYTAQLTGSSWRTISTLGLLPVLPASTLATAGFIGYGILWVLSGVSFLFSVTRRRFLFYALAPFAGVAGISFFVIYISLRGVIRTAITYNDGFFNVLSDIGALFSNFQILDLNSPALILAVDARLNQNYLVGYAAQRYLSGAVDLAYGSTIQLWALIPRVFWPNKPPVGGGNDIVSNFTGLAFGPTTSVGVGQVMEFYMNFALPGLIIGFFVLGFLLMKLDLGIMRALAKGDMRNVLLCAMPGLTLLQPGGNGLEIVVAAAGAIVTSRILAGWGFFGSGTPEPAIAAVPTIAE